MRSKYNQRIHRIDLTKDVVKAIRTLLDVNPDLRVSLGAHSSRNPTFNRAWWFVDKNLEDISLEAALDPIIQTGRFNNVKSNEWLVYEQMLNDVAGQIVR